ncbi:MAG: hypothetical protein ACRYGI_11640 [Janthinobacterium lividum]
MNDRNQLVAYIATLAALVAALIGSMLVAAFVPGVLGHIADFGVGTVTGGLIGVLRIPQRSAVASASDGPLPVTVANPDSDPVPVAPANG